MRICLPCRHRVLGVQLYIVLKFLELCILLWQLCLSPKTIFDKPTRNLKNFISKFSCHGAVEYGATATTDVLSVKFSCFDRTLSWPRLRLLKEMFFLPQLGQTQGQTHIRWHESTATLSIIVYNHFVPCIISITVILGCWTRPAWMLSEHRVSQ